MGASASASASRWPSVATARRTAPFGALGVMQVDAVEIVARLFGRDRKARLVDQAAQLGRLDVELGRRGLARHGLEVGRRKRRQRKSRASGRNRQPALATGRARFPSPRAAFCTTSKSVCAGAVIEPAFLILASAASVASMSRSVAVRLSRSPSAWSRMLDRIGIVFRRSTTAWTWESARIRALRSMVSFIRPTSSGGASVLAARRFFPENASARR